MCWMQALSKNGPRLLQGLRQAPQRRLVVIGRGSHTIQYEAERGQLYHVMSDFLLE